MTRILNALNPTYCGARAARQKMSDIFALARAWTTMSTTSISFAFEIYAPDADKIHADFEAGKRPLRTGMARREAQVVGTNLLPLPWPLLPPFRPASRAFCSRRKPRRSS